MRKMQENTDETWASRPSRSSTSAWCLRARVDGTRPRSRLRTNQIIISCKLSKPNDLIAVYRDLSRRTTQPLHLGLTEAGMGIKGLVWSASAMASC